MTVHSRLETPPHGKAEGNGASAADSEPRPSLDPDATSGSRLRHFAATYERVQPGLATFVRDAIRVRAGLPAA